ncbi:MAG: hypothetical protein NWF00_02250 [Candidatus Bathyarchaeota archaeon]|nr:hypothetical protein [Candidatus Bathyarchaeota archaeon]
MGNKSLMALTTIVTLLSCLYGAAQLGLSFGAPEPAIIIGSNGIVTSSDGVISPSNTPIKQNGSKYFLTGDLVNREIWVDTGNVTLDGNGYSSNRLISITDESNVTIQNWSISSSQCILLFNVSNVSILNNNLTSGDQPGSELSAINVDRSTSTTIAGNNIGGDKCSILMTRSASNLITRNNITNMSTGWDHTSAGIILYNCSHNTIYHNNFMDNTRGVYIGTEGLSKNIWDNGYPPEGNYWEDYQTKYPNASEVDNSEIWNTPYVIDENNIDYYPLVNQADSFAPSLNAPSGPNVSPSPTQQPTVEVTPSPSVPEFPTWILLVFTASASLLIYKQKGKRNG